MSSLPSDTRSAPIMLSFDVEKAEARPSTSNGFEAETSMTTYSCRQRALTDEEVEERGRSRLQEMARCYGAADSDGDMPSFLSDPFKFSDFSRSELRKFGPRVAFSFVFHVICIYINNVMQAWLQANFQHYYEGRWEPIPGSGANTTVILWDFVHTHLPNLESSAYADFFATAAPLVAIVRFAVIPGPMSLRWTIVSRVLVIWGLLWLLRGISIASTVLPNPQFSCEPKVTFPDNIWLEAFAILLKGDFTCQDVLFSGHTVSLTVGVLTLFKYIPLSPWFRRTTENSRFPLVMTIVKLVGTISLIMGYYSIIASHFHYSADVLLGAALTCMVFNMYHAAIRLALLQTSLKVTCYPSLLWFERYAKDIRFWAYEAEVAAVDLRTNTSFLSWAPV